MNFKDNAQLHRLQSTNNNDAESQNQQLLHWTKFTVLVYFRTEENMLLIKSQ